MQQRLQKQFRFQFLVNSYYILQMQRGLCPAVNNMLKVVAIDSPAKTKQLHSSLYTIRYKRRSNEKECFAVSVCSNSAITKFLIMPLDGVQVTLSYFFSSYKTKFGFPFIICARENKVQSIIEGLQRRYNNTREQEILTGINEVKKICRLRILDIAQLD